MTLRHKGSPETDKNGNQYEPDNYEQPGLYRANFRENKISIFSPVATALIGYKESDEIEWMVPSGMTKIRIDKIIYQPEAAGDYAL